MIRHSIIQLLAQNQLTGYLLEIREHGRKYVAPSSRRKFAELFQEVEAIIHSSPNLSPNEFITLQFASDFCGSEKFLSLGRLPRYTIYTNLGIIDRFIGVRSRWPLERTFAQCRVAISLLIRDWLEFEQSSFMSKAREEPVGIGFDQRRVSERANSLKALRDSVPADNVPHVNELNEPSPSDYSLDWEYFACHNAGAAGFLHGTSLRQSKYHDEYLFLRTLHIDEVCFWAIISGMQGAAKFVRDQAWQNAMECLRQASAFAGYLQPVFRIFKTMPFESFLDGFRKDTGDSSAIQSEKFQLLDLLVRGYNATKRQALSAIDEHARIVKRTPLAEDTLPGMFEASRAVDHPSAREFQEQCLELDRQMRAWRADHLGIVRTYLGTEVTGTGGEGFAYLQATFRDPGGLAPFAHPEAEVPAADPARPSWLISQEVAPTERPNTVIALIKAEKVSKRLLLAFIDTRSPEFLQEARARSDEIDARFAAYNSVFARYGYQSPLPGQKQRVLRDGFPPGVAQTFVLALEMTTGVLAGLHECTNLVGQVRVKKALPGTRFKPLGGGERPLKPRELYFADAKSIFATYFQGPDSRTAVRNLREQPEMDNIGDLLCLIMGAPDTPKDVFREAVKRAKEWLEHVADRTSHYFLEVEL